MRALRVSTLVLSVCIALCVMVSVVLYSHTYTPFLTGLLKESEKAYQEAMKLDLPPTDPTKLGLALNFSVFYYEIMGKTEEACKLAKKVL